jgi:hypothetical protein
MVELVEAPAPNLEWAPLLTIARVSGLSRNPIRVSEYRTCHSSKGHTDGVPFDSSGSGLSGVACWPQPRLPRHNRRWAVSLRSGTN